MGVDRQYEMPRGEGPRLVEHDPWKPGQRLPSPAFVQYAAGVATLIVAAVFLWQTQRGRGSRWR